MKGFLASVFTRLAKFWTTKRSYPQAICDASELKAKAVRKRAGNKQLFTPAQEKLRDELGLRRMNPEDKPPKRVPALKLASSAHSRLTARELKRAQELGLIRDNPDKLES